HTTPTLHPYTTPFRSARGEPADLADRHPVVELRPLRDVAEAEAEADGVVPGVEAEDRRPAGVGPQQAREHADGGRLAGAVLAERSEEHTSELQSRFDL